jgi:hypothetical protein
VGAGEEHAVAEQQPEGRTSHHDRGGSVGPGEPHHPHLAAHLAEGVRRPADTIWRRNPREQGLLGPTDAIGWFGARGWSVNLLLIDSQPYDLIVDDGRELRRVQVKTTTYRPRGRFIVQLATRGGNRSFHTSKDFDAAGCDLLYVLTDAGDRYLIPTEVIRARTGLTLGPAVAAYALR